MLNNNLLELENEQIFLRVTERINKYKKECALKSELERTELNKEKTGVFTGAYAINPVNGKEIPIWISDYVIESYGTGAVMAVPAHDERDYAFAKKFDIEIIVRQCLITRIVAYTCLKTYSIICPFVEILFRNYNRS